MSGRDALKYAALLRRISDRAEATLESGASRERGEILVTLYNDYLDKLRTILGEELEIFPNVGADDEQDPERLLTEVMVRSEQLACWIAADAKMTHREKRLGFEMPAMPTIVRRERLDEFTREMQEWGRAVAELSMQIPEKLSGYLEGLEHRRFRHRHGGVRDDADWHTEILTRLKEGDLSVDEALRLLGHEDVEGGEAGKRSPGDCCEEN